MRKNVIPYFVIIGLITLGLLLWNVYLIQQVNQLKTAHDELELRNQILKGDNDILSYDLVTTRDSLRILNKFMDKKSDSLSLR